MKKTVLRALSLIFAVGVLAAVVGRAGWGAAGCRPASHAEPQAAAPTSPTTAVADPAPAPAPPPERYFPATKAAPVFYPYDTPPSQKSQQAAPVPQVRK